MITAEELKVKLKPYFYEPGGFAGYWLPDGWVQLVDELHEDLIKICPDYKIVQVKEKFAGLRYYVELPRDIDHETADSFRERVSTAERRSYTICDVCGSPGEVREGGWISTLCDEHNKGRCSS